MLKIEIQFINEPDYYIKPIQQIIYYMPQYDPGYNLNYRWVDPIYTMPTNSIPRRCEYVIATGGLTYEG